MLVRGRFLDKHYVIRCAHGERRKNLNMYNFFQCPRHMYDLLTHPKGRQTCAVPAGQASDRHHLTLDARCICIKHPRYYRNAFSVYHYSVSAIAADEFRLFFTAMTCVPGQFFPYIFWRHQAINSHFPRWLPTKLMGMISY